MSEIHISNLMFNELLPKLLGYSFDPRIKIEMLLNREPVEDRVILSTVPNQVSNFAKVIINIEAIDCQLATCWLALVRQALEGR